MASCFSCTLLFELAVGRIIRARKPSSGGFATAPLLTRDLGRSVDVLGGFWLGRENLEDDFLSAAARGRFALVVWWGAAVARLGEREVPSDFAVFAAEAAVGAVAEAGRRTGRVGDFGRGFVVGDVFTADA